MTKLPASALAALALAPIGGEVVSAATNDKSPNIVWIMADDLGIGDLGCYGQRIIQTPNIDAMATRGMKFMQHYAGSTVSAPSRCSLLTGYHTGHAQIRANSNVPGSDGLIYDMPLASNAFTVADLLNRHGYATGCCGKWGLGGPGTEGEPLRHGFHYFYGYLGQRFAHSYYPTFLHENNNKVQLDGTVWSHDLILEHALDFIRVNTSGPFFLYYTPTLPHASLDIPEEALAAYRGLMPETPYKGSPGGYKAQPEPRAAYAAMVSRLDSSVGEIMALLEELGLIQNTIVVFTSDNGAHAEGGHDPYAFDSNGPWRGCKRDLYEGGVRTPFVVQWPKYVAEGVVTTHISTFWDFLPTVAELMGEEAPDGDGISYLPTLLGKEGQKKHESIYYEFYEQGGKQSVLTPDGWKLVRLHAFDDAPATEVLFNILDDPAETTDVARQYPTEADRLRLLMDASHTPLPK